MKAIFALSLIVISVVVAAAQSDEVKRVEFFAGYSLGSAGVSFGTAGAAAQVYRGRTRQDGFNASGAVNLGRYFGVKGDVSGTYASKRYAFTVPSGIQSNPTTTVSFDGKTSLYNFLGGVQVKDNASGARFSPFAHALVGAARRKNEIPGGGMVCIAIIPCPGSTNETGFAAAFGGGVDVRLSKRVAWRLFQADYNPAKFDAGTDHNFRISTGLVFR